MDSNLDTIQEQIDLKKQHEDQVLSFILGTEEYGVDILTVQEIKGWEKTTKIPNTPDYVKGVINLRGAVVPIIDLRIRFGLQQITYNDSTVVIILRAEDTNGSHKIIGLVVDGVSDVYSLNRSQIQSSPDMNGSIHTDYVQGLATVADKMIVILNVNQLINEGILALIRKSLHTE
jgi:purine-binding chemotaxis protein CheW